MKIHVISTGKTTINADPDYEEAPIRSALEELAELGPDETGRYLPDVAVAIIDHTDSERSDISHDEYAIVTEDDGGELWRGWLNGSDEPAPPDPVALGQLVRDWEAAANEEERLSSEGPWGNRGEHGNRAAMIRDHARKLGALLGQPS